MSIRFNAKNLIFNERPIVINKETVNPVKIVKATVMSAIYTLQELFLFSAVLLIVQYILQ